MYINLQQQCHYPSPPFHTHKIFLKVSKPFYIRQPTWLGFTLGLPGIWAGVRDPLPLLSLNFLLGFSSVTLPRFPEVGGGGVDSGYQNTQQLSVSYILTRLVACIPRFTSTIKLTIFQSFRLTIRSDISLQHLVNVQHGHPSMH